MRQVQVLDCTVRDGGLMNKWRFAPQFVRDSLSAAVASGVDYIELGYKAAIDYFDPREYGIWRFCNEADLQDFAVDRLQATRLAIMLDIGRFHLSDIIPATDSIIDTFRVACYAHQIPQAIATSLALDDLGYETFVNIMAVTEAPTNQLDAGLRAIAANSPTKGVYVVDSYGYLNPDNTKSLVERYAALCPGKLIGFHGHNNQQLALANSLAAIAAGAAIIDASLHGMGRRAGNTPLELLLSQLGRSLRQIAPLFAVIERHVLALQTELQWGYHLPYILAGIANEHPRQAMELMDNRLGAVASGYLEQLTG